MMMSDLIDRNDAVEAIEFEKVYMTAYKGSSNGYVSEGNPFTQYNKGLDDAIKAINNLTPVKPERKWIPVTERLPEEDKDVLVFGVEAISNEYVYGVKRLDVDTWRPRIAPSIRWIAWMPLPEPYGGE